MGNLYSKDHCFVLWFTSRLAVWNPVPWGVLLEMLAHQQARQRSVHSWVKSITLFLATAAKYWKKILPGTSFGFPTSLQVIDDFFSILLRQILLNNFTAITKPSKQLFACKLQKSCRWSASWVRWRMLRDIQPPTRKTVRRMLSLHSWYPVFCSNISWCFQNLVANKGWLCTLEQNACLQVAYLPK